MNDARYHLLDSISDSQLTQEELDEGWHWCADFDGLLVGPGMSALECCTCDYESVIAAKRAHLEARDDDEALEHELF